MNELGQHIQQKLEDAYQVRQKAKNLLNQAKLKVEAMIEGEVANG